VFSLILKATSGQPTGREQHRRERARLELAEAATQLHVGGTEPFSILLELSRLNLLLDRPFPSVLPFVRALPGLERWRPGQDWQERLAFADQESLTAGLESPADEEQDRRRRAWALASWLNVRGGSLIAEEVVQAAEVIARRHAGQEVTGD
jgi:hypothetical protein